MAGKVHHFTQPIAGGPTTRGFDTYFGTDVPNWPPYCFIENDRTIGIPSVPLPAEFFRNHLASTPGPALPDWKLEAILPALTERACAFITDAAGKVEEVKGLGVVGHQPLLRPGESFQYSSASRLRTATGTMHGQYFCVAEDGTRFEAEIPMFVLEATPGSPSRVLH